MEDPKFLLVEMARACNRYAIEAIKLKDWALVIEYQDDRDCFMAMARARGEA